MWPQTLEMSRDECRGMLRRLELESYSHLISVFRAQGSLSEPKAKLLEELRQLFHITQERHRAEVRRAANDEQLCTIAENVCGPNTWQEWSREGRRPYPLLPRIHPQTALSIVANDLAAKAFAENAKLPPPAETGANLAEALLDQASYVTLKHGKAKTLEPHVILEEPFKVPDVPNEVKKATQKRKENDSDAKSHKKRNTQQDKQQQQQLGNNEELHQGGGLGEEGGKASARTLQQRYFYQQQQKHKQRMASKRSLAAQNHSPGGGGGGGSGGGTPKRTAAPAKSGRRAQKQQQQKQQQQQQQQQQQKVLMPAVEATTPMETGHNLLEIIIDEALKAATPSPASTPTFVKAKQRVETEASPTPTATPLVLYKEKEQKPQLMTPVKKYIVEERQPSPALVSAPIESRIQPAAICTANLPLAPQIISVQQIPAPPKLRSSIVPPKRLSFVEERAKTATTLQLSQLKQPPVQKYIVEERPLAATSSPLSSASTVNIIKNLPASSLNNTLITPLATTMAMAAATPTATVTATPSPTPTPTPSPTANANVATVFRSHKAPISIKSLQAANLGGNIKLTPSFNLKQMPSSALRNFKLCSPNGKVFLQPAKLAAGQIIHKLNNVSSPTSSPTSPTSPQHSRITIQKMQILTPNISSSSTNVAGKVKPGTLTFGGSKNNVVFLPASAASGMRTVTLSTKPGGGLSLASSQQRPASEVKPNVLVIGNSSTTTTTTTAKANQLITEDTPIDIINMPIIVADNNGAATPTVTPTAELKASALSSTLTSKATPPAQQLLVLNATDWEMELDQASKTTTTTVTTTTTATTTTAINKIVPSKENLKDLIVECGNDPGEDLEELEEEMEEVEVEQLNNRIIELDDENNAIEYVDMDLEQPIPIEIESSSHQTATPTAASLKTSIAVSSPLFVAEKAAQRQLAATTTTIKTTTATLP